MADGTLPPDGDGIRHVVLLMLENWSFDLMGGCLKAVNPEIDGVDFAKPGVNEFNHIAYPQQLAARYVITSDPIHELSERRAAAG